MFFFLYRTIKTDFSFEKSIQPVNLIDFGIYFHPTGEADHQKKFEEEKKLVDIGFPAARLTRQQETKLRMEFQKQIKNNPEIEKLARHLKCKASTFASDG